MRLPRFGVEEWLNVHEMSALYDLASVSIQSMDLDELFELTRIDGSAFFKKLRETTLNYGWIEGSPDFKEAVASLYERQASENILQTNGATGANLLALYSLVEPGDHVISLYPSYQQLYDIPKSFGAEVDFWSIKKENQWLPDLDELRQLIRPDTKLICINNANNPTGAVMDRDFLLELVDIAQSVGAYILSDEVYKTFDDSLDVPAICDLYDKGISVNSLSKTYSLPGVRIGWVAASRELCEVFRDYRDYTLICAGVFDDMVATLALQHHHAILERNKQLVVTNLKILEDWVEEEPLVSLISAAVTPTSFIQFHLDQDIEDFCLSLLKEKGVLLVPGNRFDLPGHARLGYCCQTEVLQKGLYLLSDFLKQYSCN